MKPPELTTERLRLRPLRPDDTGALLAAWSDPETLRHWHRAPRATPEALQPVVDEMLAPPGACYWAICLRGSDEALGHVGYPDHAPGRLAPFGYLLRRDRWGQGLAFEATRAALRVGVERLHLCGAELWIHAANARSLRLAERLGCTQRGRFVAFHAERGGRFDTLVYGVTAEELGVDDAPPGPVAFYGLAPILETTDVPAALDFYVRRLGFRLDWSVGTPPRAAGVSRGHWTPQTATIHFTTVAEEPRRRSGVLSIGVDDVDRLAAELIAAGVAIEEGPVTRPWGFRELDVLDPLGQRLRFLCPAPGDSGAR